VRKWDSLVITVWAVMIVGVQLLAVLTAVWNFSVPSARHGNPDEYRGQVAAYWLMTLLLVVPAAGVVAARRAGRRGHLIAFAVIGALGLIANVIWYATRV
jgi:hypothetical protein